MKIFLATFNNFEGTNTCCILKCMIDLCAYGQYKQHQQPNFYLSISSVSHAHSFHPDPFFCRSTLPFYCTLPSSSHSVLLCLNCTLFCFFFTLVQLVISLSVCPSTCLSVCLSEWGECVFWCGELAAVCTARDRSGYLLSQTTRSPRARSPRPIRCTPRRCGGTKWWPRHYPPAPSSPPALSAPGLYAAGCLAQRAESKFTNKTNIQ